MTGSEGGNVGLGGGHRDDWFSGGDDAEHFTGDNDTFKTSLNGNDVGVGCSENRGNFGAWKEWQEADVLSVGCQRFQTGTLGSVTDKNKSDIFFFELARGSNDGVPCAVKT